MLEKIINEGLVRGYKTVEVFSEKNRTSIYEDFTNYRAEHHQKNNNAIVRAFRNTGEPVGFKISAPYPSFESFKDAFFNIYTIDSSDKSENSADLLPESVKNLKLKIYDSKISDLGEDFFKDLKEQAYETILKYPKLNLKKISFHKTEKKVYLFNSNGLRAKYKKTLFKFIINLNLNSKSIIVSDIRTLSSLLSPEKTILRGLRILNSITDKPAPLNKDCPFILTPQASITLLRTFNSYFKVHSSKFRIKNIRFPSVLNIVDNPFLDYEPGSVPFDDEGIQHDAKFIMIKGQVKDKISNIKDGLNHHKQSTGNGFRNNQFIFPQTTFTNLYIKPTTMPLKHLMGSSQKGIFITTLKQVYLKDQYYYFLAFGYSFFNGQLKEPVHFTLKTSLNSYLLSILKISRGLRFDFDLINIGSPYILSEGEYISSNYFKI